MTQQEQLRKQIDLENGARVKAVKVRKESALKSEIAGLRLEVDLLKTGLAEARQRIAAVESAHTTARRGKANG